MSRATAHTRNFAQRLMAHEAKGNKSAANEFSAAFPVCDKLRPHLTTLMGNTGFRALLSRALALAHAEVPWLRAVHVKSDGSLEGLAELHAQLAPEEFFEGRVELVAQLLGLLIAFIGENLMVQIIREAWPKLPRNELDLDNGGKK